MVLLPRGRYRITLLDTCFQQVHCLRCSKSIFRTAARCSPHEAEAILQRQIQIEHLTTKAQLEDVVEQTQTKPYRRTVDG